MPDKTLTPDYKRLRSLVKKYILRPVTAQWRRTVSYWRQTWWHKVLLSLAILVAVLLIGMYGIARWYIWTENQPLTLGASFVADYASYLGVDPHETFTAMLSDLHIKHVRLVSYWSDIEPKQGQYNFSELDWEFRQAQRYGAKVTLAIGMRQPRWPECHPPTWVIPESVAVWQPQLETFMTAVINRYKDNPALQSYQLENEFLLKVFGTCTDFSRQRLIDETNLVRRLDPQHTLIISRSNNALGWPINQPHADEYAVSIYHRVWTPLLGRYIEYPFPGWYYAFLAGIEKIWSGKDTFIHELQTEPWTPLNSPIPDSSLAEQDKSLNATRLKQTVEAGKATGMKTIDLWGAEYWYYRKVKLHEPSVWNEARQIYADANSGK